MRHLILFNSPRKPLVFLVSTFVVLFSSCSTTQLQSKLAAKSDPSLCYSMIYEKDSASNEFFTLMLSEALSRNLNCKDIAQEILDYRKKLLAMTAVEDLIHLAKVRLLLSKMKELIGSLVNLLKINKRFYLYILFTLQ